MIVKDVIIRNSLGVDYSLMTLPLYVTSMSGLGVTCQLNTTEVYGQDGSVMNTQRMGNRTVTLGVSNFGETYTSQNDWIYSIFRIYEDIIMFVKGEDNNGNYMCRRITGRVSKIDTANFTANDTYKIQLLCLDPYFHDEGVTQVDNYYANPMFEFPLELFADKPLEIAIRRSSHLTTLENPTSLSVGFVTRFMAKSAFFGCSVTQLETGEYFALRGTTKINVGETIVFDTRLGSREVYRLDVNGVKTNMLSYLDMGSTFFEIPPNGCTVTFEITTGDPDLVDVDYSYDICYGGI